MDTWRIISSSSFRFVQARISQYQMLSMHYGFRHGASARDCEFKGTSGCVRLYYRLWSVLFGRFEQTCCTKYGRITCYYVMFGYYLSIPGACLILQNSKSSIFLKDPARVQQHFWRVQAT